MIFEYADKNYPPMTENYLLEMGKFVTMMF